MRIVPPIVLPLLLLSAPGSLAAQGNAAAPQAGGDCRTASQALATGSPEVPVEWALGKVRNCGIETWAAGISAAVRREKRSTDVERLNDLWFGSQRLRDRRIYEAALSIAADRSASVPSRALALGALRWLVRGPSQIVTEYAEMVAGPDPLTGVRRSCSYRNMVNWTWEEGQPLPADYRSRILALARELARDPGQPVEVRIAANCV